MDNTLPIYVHFIRVEASAIEATPNWVTFFKMGLLFIFSFCFVSCSAQVTAYNEPKEDTPIDEVQDQFFEMCKNDEAESHWSQDVNEAWKHHLKYYIKNLNSKTIRIIIIILQFVYRTKAAKRMWNKSA